MFGNAKTLLALSALELLFGANAQRAFDEDTIRVGMACDDDRRFGFLNAKSQVFISESIATLFDLRAAFECWTGFVHLATELFLGISFVENSLRDFGNDIG